MKKDTFHILLMEDDLGLAKLCQKKLKIAGYTTAHAADGEKGMDMLKGDEAFDLVILDQEMPVYNGLEVLRRLAEDGGTLPPIVMVTGAGSENIAVEAMRLGARDYIVKDAEGVYLDLLPTVVTRAYALHHMDAEARLAAKVFETAAEGIMITDPDKKIISVNEALCDITGYEAEELIGKTPEMFHSGQQSESFYKDMEQSLEHTGHWQGEVWNRLKNGKTCPMSLTITAVQDDNKRVINYAAFMTDISDRKQAEENLRWLATHDPLTALPNRNLFRDRLAQALTLAERNSYIVGVMVMDLDHFKAVNDTFGHDTGDIVLQNVAKRLRGVLRKSDTAARLGGDEFTVLLPKIKDIKEAEQLAQRICEAMAKPHAIDTRECISTVSIGVSTYPTHGDDPESLLKAADMAAYQAKKKRNMYCVRN